MYIYELYANNCAHKKAHMEIVQKKRTVLFVQTKKCTYRKMHTLTIKNALLKFGDRNMRTQKNAYTAEITYKVIEAYMNSHK